MTFRLVCDPPKTAHHAKRIVKFGKISTLADKPELVEAKTTLEQLLMPHQPAQPVAGAVVVSLEWVWPWLKSHGPKIRALGRIPHTSKPDLTNVAKTLEDRLKVLRFIEDDAKVVELRLSKWWGDQPGIVVTIGPFEAYALLHGAR